MQIHLNNIGKRFNSDWIFRNVDCEFNSGNAYAILGANGSGKSTLLQIIAGNISATEGDLTLTLSKGEGTSSPIPPSPAGEGLGVRANNETIFRHLSFASPYLELPEEMTLTEIIKFHFKFKKPVTNFSPEKIIQLTELEKSKDKQLKYFSSGMKQRVRLALAILSDTEILLLDEPCTNLDKNGINWYRNLMESYSKERLVIVCSNHQEQEYDFCRDKISMEDFKNNIFTESQSR